MVKKDEVGDNGRVRKAFNDYKAKFPDDDVKEEDFKYVGIAPQGSLKTWKEDMIECMEAKHNDL